MAVPVQDFYRGGAPSLQAIRTAWALVHSLKQRPRYPRLPIPSRLPPRLPPHACRLAAVSRLSLVSSSSPFLCHWRALFFFPSSGSFMACCVLVL